MTVKLLSRPDSFRPIKPAAMLHTLRGWLHRQRERQQLLHLDDRMLRDIGLSRADAEKEAAKPFWVA